jgi:hypothetical protein
MYIISKQVKEPAADNRRLPRPSGDSTADRKKPGANSTPDMQLKHVEGQKNESRFYS